VAPRDRAYDVLQTLYDRDIPGFGELFRMLSWRDIGTAALLSRASAGIVGSVLIVSMPGSPNAIDLAMRELVLPELAHLLGELQRPVDPEETS
jgi:molybdenum cofactor biosynthesis protein B